MKRVLVVASLLAGCKTATDDPTVVAVNALVAPENAAKLQFERNEIVATATNYLREPKFALPLPKGWRHPDPELARVEAIDGDNCVTLVSSCSRLDPPCVQEDWNAIIDRDLNVLRDFIVRDERTPNRRIVVYKLAALHDKYPMLHVVVYWWTNDGNEYFTCDAKLGPDLAPSAAAFEKACMSAKVIDILERR